MWSQWESCDTKTSFKSFWTYLRSTHFICDQNQYWTPHECHDSGRNNENKLLEDWMLGNGLYSLHRKLTVMYTVPMTECVVVVLELQWHVRISTSFDSIWIIDSLATRKHTIANHQRPISFRIRFILNNIRYCRTPEDTPLSTMDYCNIKVISSGEI